VKTEWILYGGGILGLFIKEKRKSKAHQKLNSSLSKNSCDQKFYIETLKLKPEEIPLFLNFVIVTQNQKTLIENSSVYR
jgi:hypothetical protein